MNKITTEAAIAFRDTENYHKANTRVVVSNCCVDMYLHDNLIARKFCAKDTLIQTCGWDSSVTKRRLNGIHGVHVYHKNKILYLNDKEWDGELTLINN